MKLPREEWHNPEGWFKYLTKISDVRTENGGISLELKIVKVLVKRRTKSKQPRYVWVDMSRLLD